MQVTIAQPSRWLIWFLVAVQLQASFGVCAPWWPVCCTLSFPLHLPAAGPVLAHSPSCHQLASVAVHPVEQDCAVQHQPPRLPHAGRGPESPLNCGFQGPLARKAWTSWLVWQVRTSPWLPWQTPQYTCCCDLSSSCILGASLLLLCLKTS